MPSPPRIYADFNAIERDPRGAQLADVSITGYGTLASLAEQRLRISEGMRVILFEPEDIECEGVAHFDETRTDPAGRVGEWVVRVDAQAIRSCTSGSLPKSHPCFGCGINLLPHLETVGQRFIECCPSCGTSIMAPLAPPESAA